MREMQAIPRCLRGPLPSARSDTSLRSFRLASHYPARASTPRLSLYGSVDTESSRNDDFRESHISIGISPRYSQHPFGSATQTAIWIHKMSSGPKSNRGSLMIAPERRDTAEAPFKRKSPRQLCAPMPPRILCIAQGLNTQPERGRQKWVRLKRNLLTQYMRRKPKVVVSYPGRYQPCGSTGGFCLV